jgi:hypothetical protein
VFKIFAFLVGSEWSAPSLLSGVILVFSFFWLFIYENRFFGCLLNLFESVSNISRKIFKEKSDICAEILDKIFTKSLTSGKVPSDWNHANVAPMYKKGDKLP